MSISINEVAETSNLLCVVKDFAEHVKDKKLKYYELEYSCIHGEKS